MNRQLNNDMPALAVRRTAVQRTAVPMIAIPRNSIPPHSIPWTAMLLFLAVLLGAGCAVKPTPYQPRDEDGWGYEESRLQERLFRVSFKGNRRTQEADLLDFLFLRCAELTQQHGYTHFVIKENYGRTQISLAGRGPRMSLGFGVGMSRGRGSSFFGLGFGSGPPSGEVYISYHLGMFVIELITAEEAQELGTNAMEAKYIIQSLTPKKKRSLAEDES